MKTWAQFLGVSESRSDTLRLPIDKQQYEAIQLDAFKAGMEFAAKVCMQPHFIYQGGHGEARLSPCVDYQKAILTAAANLKELPKI